MNTDRFRYETAPVYRNPALEGRPGWYGEGPVPDQGPYETEMVPTGLPEQDPRWTPPGSMIARQPELAQFSAENGGMAPGVANPLGARALYIFQNGEDTLYRLHGSPEWKSIGRAVSSGCVRLLNQDIIDLYNRVPAKAPILVI